MCNRAWHMGMKHTSSMITDIDGGSFLHTAIYPAIIPQKDNKHVPWCEEHTPKDEPEPVNTAEKAYTIENCCNCSGEDCSVTNDSILWCIDWKPEGE